MAQKIILTLAMCLIFFEAMAEEIPIDVSYEQAMTGIAHLFDISLSINDGVPLWLGLSPTDVSLSIFGTYQNLHGLVWAWHFPDQRNGYIEKNIEITELILSNAIPEWSESKKWLISTIKKTKKNKPYKIKKIIQNKSLSLQYTGDLLVIIIQHKNNPDQ